MWLDQWGSVSGLGTTYRPQPQCLILFLKVYAIWELFSLWLKKLFLDIPYVLLWQFRTTNVNYKKQKSHIHALSVNSISFSLTKNQLSNPDIAYFFTNKLPHIWKIVNMLSFWHFTSMHQTKDWNWWKNQTENEPSSVLSVTHTINLIGVPVSVFYC